MTTCKHDEKNTAHMTDAAAGHAPGQTPAINSGSTPGLVSFVGAGPGDPELLTLKGRKAIEEAALVLYAGSLVPPQVVACAAPDVPVVDSAPLSLEECHALVRRTALEGGTVARVHTGDPALYGTLREQTRLLDADGIPWRVIPGVTAACAAAAAAGVTFTVPEVTRASSSPGWKDAPPCRNAKPYAALPLTARPWPYTCRQHPARRCRPTCCATCRLKHRCCALAAWAGRTSASYGPPPEPWPDALRSTA